MKYYSGVNKKESARKNTVRTNDRLEFKVLAKIVKKARTKAKVTQRELSVKIGRSDSYIGKFESDRIYPDLATALDILLALNLDPGTTITEILAEVKKKTKT